MIKRRRKMDKKKRRCLYGAEKKPNSIQCIDTTTISLIEEEPTVKTNKNGRIINIKVEEKINVDHSTVEKSETKCKSADKSTKKDKTIEKSKEENIEDVKVEVSNPKIPTKTKQRYKHIVIFFVYMHVCMVFDVYYNNEWHTCRMLSTILHDYGK